MTGSRDGALFYCGSMIVLVFPIFMVSIYEFLLV